MVPSDNGERLATGDSEGMMKWLLTKRSAKARRKRVRVIEAPEPEPKPKRRTKKKIELPPEPELILKAPATEAEVTEGGDTG